MVEFSSACASARPLWLTLPPTLHPPPEVDVVIVGAGSAGLSCAYELSKYPEVKVAIIEQVGRCLAGAAWSWV